MNYDVLVNKDNKINQDYYKSVLSLLSSVPFKRDNDTIFNSFGIKDKKIFLENETMKNWLQLKTYINNKKNIQFDICSGFLTI